MPYSRLEFRKESTQEWVTVEQRDPADEDGLRIIGVGKEGVLTILYADIPGNSWNQNRLNKFAQIATERLIERTPLSDPSLVDDEYGPNGVDPALPYLYWDGGDLCCQTIIVHDAKFENGKLTFSVTRLR